ncbi:hypothetical protein BKA62DRAFT_757041 [Auriculariales sp. MPI-PUGE-AT-0066]|nr:hypothetical protein BKA62DRAFT_757041 [Auriculariales sp. MPI-PUGE-AT-0066]
MPALADAGTYTSNSDNDIFAELDIPDWRNAPPKPPPKPSPWANIMVEMMSRSGEPPDADEEHPAPPSPTTKTPHQERMPSLQVSSRRIPREVTFEIMRASPDLVAAFNDARAEYADAIYSWWWKSGTRDRDDQPSDLDYELVKLDPRVQRAAKALDDADRRLSAKGVVVKQETVRNDGYARRHMNIETERIDEQWHAARAGGAPAGKPTSRSKASASTAELVSDVDTKPTRRRRTAKGRVDIPPTPDADTPQSPASPGNSSLLAGRSDDGETVPTTPEADELLCVPVTKQSSSARPVTLEPPAPAVPLKRKRGRPRKHPLPTQ